MAALSYSDFLVDFSEFGKVERKTVERRLASAHRQISEAVWGDTYLDGVGYLAAHLLAVGAKGQPARLVPASAKATREDSLTTYEREFRRLQRQVTSGFRVTGGTPTVP